MLGDHSKAKIIFHFYMRRELADQYYIVNLVSPYPAQHSTSPSTIAHSCPVKQEDRNTIIIFFTFQAMIVYREKREDRTMSV